MYNINLNDSIDSASADQKNTANEGKLTRVIYRSRSLMEEGGEHVILEGCRKKNPLLEVTGVLVSHSGWFMQVLEGSDANIKKLVEVIKADPRHTDFLVISTTVINKRDFNDWSMASITVDELRFNQIVKQCMEGNNNAIEEVRDFLFYGKWQ